MTILAGRDRPASAWYESAGWPGLVAEFPLGCLSAEEAAALLREVNAVIDGDRYFLSPRIKALEAIRGKLRSEPAREPLAPPPKRYAPPRASNASRRRG